MKIMVKLGIEFVDGKTLGFNLWPQWDWLTVIYAAKFKQKPWFFHIF